MVTNRQIAKAFRLASQLMELHGENAFKIRGLQNAAFRIDKLGVALSTLSTSELAEIEGIGKSLQQKITEFISRQSFSELDDLIARTPAGIVEMLSIKGIGPKKILQLWKELEIISPGELLYACNENRLVSLKGFGEKTQKQIREAIEFRLSNASVCLYPVAEFLSNEIIEALTSKGFSGRIEITGETRRRCEVITSIDFLCTLKEAQITSVLGEMEGFRDQEVKNTEADFFGIKFKSIEVFFEERINFRFYFCTEKNFEHSLFLTSSSIAHVERLQSEFKLEISDSSASENGIYSSIGLPYFVPELREGLHEFDLLKKKALPELIQKKELKGILHNHSTYSDGNDTLETMAAYCKELGYEYFGICDHSKSAFYANGLNEDAIIRQHEEIDALNKKLFPFKIFKGIESDILNDGRLDYTNDILKTFDFIVASVHSNLRMDEDKATARLIKAIENPYTTILGHPTGRLLLSRPGYPVNYKKIIDACAANGVVMELNANPYRLDLDWRQIPYALEKNIMISINPDAHRKEGFHDLHYGTLAARKGGLTASMTFNSLPLKKIEEFFMSRKKVFA